MAIGESGPSAGATSAGGAALNTDLGFGTPPRDVDAKSSIKHEQHGVQPHTAFHSSVVLCTAVEHVSSANPYPQASHRFVLLSVN